MPFKRTKETDKITNIGDKSQNLKEKLIYEPLEKWTYQKRNFWWSASQSTAYQSLPFSCISRFKPLSKKHVRVGSMEDLCLNYKIMEGVFATRIIVQADDSLIVGTTVLLYVKKHETDDLFSNPRQTLQLRIACFNGVQLYVRGGDMM